LFTVCGSLLSVPHPQGDLSHYESFSNAGLHPVAKIPNNEYDMAGVAYGKHFVLGETS